MARSDLENALTHVKHDRRKFFQTLFIGAGTAVAAVPLMTTQSIAQGEGKDPGPDGKCDEGLVVSKKTGKCIRPRKKKGM